MALVVTTVVGGQAVATHESGLTSKSHLYGCWHWWCLALHRALRLCDSSVVPCAGGTTWQDAAQCPCGCLCPHDSTQARNFQVLQTLIQGNHMPASVGQPVMLPHGPSNFVSASIVATALARQLDTTVAQTSDSLCAARHTRVTSHHTQEHGLALQRAMSADNFPALIALGVGQLPIKSIDCPIKPQSPDTIRSDF